MKVLGETKIFKLSQHPALMKEGDKCHYQPAMASLLRLGKNMSTATENSKKFAFRSEKYNNT